MTWSQYAVTVRRLIIARGLRSLGQGMMIVNFALYLKALGWDATAIGLLLTASGLAGALLGLGVGSFSDRHGRKPFILAYETMTIISALAAMLSASPYLIVLASVLAGFGRGQNGGAGPFGPAEQAWLARLVKPEIRSQLFSQNAAVGFTGMGVGALLAGTVQILGSWLPGAEAFRPLFSLLVMGSGINLLMLSRLPDVQSTPAHGRTPNLSAASTAVIHQENRNLVKLSLANIMNGLAVGLTGPLISYWFAVKFGAKPAEIGVLMAVSFVATAGSNLVVAKLADRFGVVKSVVAVRVLGVLMLILLPLTGSFVLASVLYFVRSVLNRGSLGTRQAVSLSLTRDERRGLASSLNMASMRVPASVGPTVAGYLMDTDNLSLPFFLGAALQLGYAFTYGKFFGHLDETLSRAKAPAVAKHPTARQPAP